MKNIAQKKTENQKSEKQVSVQSSRKRVHRASGFHEFSAEQGW